MVKIIKTPKRDFFADEVSHAMEKLELEQRAWECGYYKRSPQKLTISSIVEGFWMMQKHGVNTLRNWAVFSGLQISTTVTKQAIDNRLNESLLKVLEQTLLHSLSLKLDTKWLSKKKQELNGLLGHFNRIILQDSTVQQVPTQLYEIVSGNKTSSGNRALMRIQAVFNFTDERWENFSIDTYSQNDKSQSTFGLDNFQKRDLILRDLGYFVIDTVAQITKEQYVISPYNPGVILYDLQENQIDLLALLKKKKALDIDVLVTRKSKLPMRLVARKLTKQCKQKKIKSAKRKAHAKCKYTDKYFELLGYEIYLTNIPSNILAAKDIAKMYGLRWYIEILFKSWKSYFNFRLMFEQKKMDYQRTKITIYLLLIQFVYLTNYVYQYIKQQLEEQKHEFISSLKFMDLSKCLLAKILSVNSLSELDQLIPQFALHAVYEKRKKRKNMNQKHQYFKELKSG